MTQSQILRRGMTLMEVVVALAVLMAAMIGVAQLSVWASAERTRQEARAAAIELTANQMELARAKPWDELTEAWAADAKLPESFAARWPDAKLSVTVVAESERLKRVTVTLRWEGDNRRTLVPVVLVSQFAARSGGGE